MDDRRAGLGQTRALPRSRWIAWPKIAPGPSRPARLVGVEIVARLRDKAPRTQATSSICSDRWVCIRQSGCSAQSAPSAASCSGVEVGEKRGVMA